MTAIAMLGFITIMMPMLAVLCALVGDIALEGRYGEELIVRRLIGIDELPSFKWTEQERRNAPWQGFWALTSAARA